MFGPNPDEVHPNENLPSVCYIKNVIIRPNIEVGAYPITTTRTPAARISRCM